MCARFIAQRCRIAHGVRKSTYIIWSEKRPGKRGFEAFNLRRCVVSRYAFSIFEGCAALPFSRSSKLSFIIDSPAFEVPFSFFQETVLVAYTTSDLSAMTRSRIRRHWYASETYIHPCTRCLPSFYFSLCLWIIGKLRYYSFAMYY